MIPNHILSEVIERLATPLVAQRTIDRVLNAVGIDIEQALQPLCDVDQTVGRVGSTSICTGTIEFDLAVHVAGHIAQHRCRAVYRQEIDDHIDPKSETATRLPTRTEWEYEVLSWDADAPSEEAKSVNGRRSAPQWTAATLLNLIPRVAEQQITDAIEADALRRDATS